jgi:hypothetical protein
MVYLIWVEDTSKDTAMRITKQDVFARVDYVNERSGHEMFTLGSIMLCKIGDWYAIQLVTDSYGARTTVVSGTLRECYIYLCGYIANMDNNFSRVIDTFSR